MSGQHARFQARMRQSSAALFAVAKYLHDGGFDIEIRGMRVAPKASQHEAFADAGDLHVWINGKRELVQVKGRQFNFTSADDFPYVSMMVGSVASLDRVTDALYYVGVSLNLEYAAIAHRDTRPDWTIKTTTVSNTGNVESNYVCPISLLKFTRLMRHDEIHGNNSRA